jgi:actin-like ATPase involved in cell morphogenesis
MDEIDKPASKALIPIGAGTAAVALLVVSVVVTKAFGDVLIDLMLMAIAFGVGWWKGKAS